MKHVFISYKREDEIRVGRLARALEYANLQVWWDRGLPGGESWHANIEAKLRDAGCVVVVWSAHSAGDDGGYVREEARRGLSRNILVPVLIDKLDQLPLGFGEIQAIDLTRWRGERRDPDLQDLIGTIRAKLDNQPLPRPTGPTKRIARRLMWGGASGTALAVIALITFNVSGVSSHLCTLPGFQPSLSDACGALKLGERPTGSERVAWDSRIPGSCSALREHIARFPDGALRRKAADLLAARTISTVEIWQPTTRKLALFEAADSAAINESVARARALTHAAAQADRLCRDFGAGTLYRFVAASAAAERWNCSRRGNAVVCGFDGYAECQLSERHATQQEQCS